MVKTYQEFQEQCRRCTKQEVLLMDFVKDPETKKDILVYFMKCDKCWKQKDPG